MLCKWSGLQSDDENDSAEGLKKLNITPGKLHHCALSEGKSAAAQFDVVLCAQNFLNMFKDAEKRGTVVIGLRNIYVHAGDGREAERAWNSLTDCTFLQAEENSA